MPLSVQLSIVAAAAAFVVLAIAATRALLRLDRAIDQITKATAEMREVIVSFRDLAPRVRRVIEHFEQLGDRVVGLSTSVLNEIERPVRTALAIVRGFRTGTSGLMQKLSRRFNNGVLQKGEHL